MLGATQGGSDAVGLCSANPCLASVQIPPTPHPHSSPIQPGGAKETWLCSPSGGCGPWPVLESSFLLSKTLRDSGRGIQEETKCLSAVIIQHMPTTPWPAHRQWNVSVSHNILMGAVQEKSTSSSHHDTWVEKDNCGTCQSLSVLRGVPSEGVLILLACPLESSIGTVLLWGTGGYSASWVVVTQAPFLLWLLTPIGPFLAVAT